jgi:hypothetical protein
MFYDNNKNDNKYHINRNNNNNSRYLYIYNTMIQIFDLKITCYYLL